MKQPQFHFAPSIYHQRLMASIRPSLSYKGGNVAQWQRSFRRRLGDLLGFSRPKRIPLKARVLWARNHPLGRIEKVVFTSEPYADVPAYICLPSSAKPPYTFFICLQGHSTGMHISLAVDRKTETKSIKVDGDRDFAWGCMRRGIAALCLEQRAFGERSETLMKPHAQAGCHEASMNALMLGHTLLGERVADIDRAIDYLESRGDADMRRIGVMGNSGGGTATVFASALLPRISFAMPSGCFCTFRESILSIYHCMCNYVPCLEQYGEMADVLGLFAPRPVVVVSGLKDTIFPIRGARREFQRLKAIYRAAGAERHCHMAIGKGGHRFYAREGWTRMLKEIRESR